MTPVAEVPTSTQRYLDRAVGALRDMGLMPETPSEAPILPLLDKISGIDEGRVVTIARTLTQAPLFNEVVREEITAMKIGERYEDISSAFNSIRDDAKSLVDQIADGKIDTFERLGNVWMKVTRGDVSSRFDKIRATYLEVARDTKDQIEREHRILEAYKDFRGALKQAEVLALEVLKKAEGRLDKARDSVAEASKVLETMSRDDAAMVARNELARDEKVRDLQDEEKRYQIAKDLSDNLTVGYNTSEVIMARLTQTTDAKERIYQQSVSFFSTNETVLTALNASFTGMFGLHESTEVLNEMKEGMSKSLETLSEIGAKVQEEALRAGYGPTIRADAVKMLVDSVISYQERSREIIEEMRKQSTRNAEEIRDAVEDGKQRLARLAQQAAV
ncbi:MAG: cell surface protein [Pseudomonadota bacterium]